MINKLEQPVEVHVESEEQLYSHIDDLILLARHGTFWIELLVGEVELT